MTHVLFLRHGPTDWNASGRLQGRADVALQSQARAWLGRCRLPVEVQGFEWVSSPLSRARETARTLAGCEVAADDRLVEMDWGAWEGQSLDVLRRIHGSQMERNEARGLDFRPPGGESPREVQLRLRGWLREVAASGRSVIAVTHKGVMRAALSLACGWDMKGRAPVKVLWTHGHLYALSRTGSLAIKRLDLELTP